MWFQGIKYVTGKYKLHEEYIIFGKPTVFNGRINVAHPDIDNPADLKLSSMGLQPYYNTTEKMKRSFLNSHAIEKMMATIIGQIVSFSISLHYMFHFKNIVLNRSCFQI